VASAEELIYADSSALVKLIVRESESAALAAAIPSTARVATSGVALVEVTRTIRVGGLENEIEGDVLAGCVVIDVDAGILRSAAALASDVLRPLDAIHLATALAVEANVMYVYDRQLGRAARELGLRVAAPGAE
jgi:predicted nucleic acid-binding protein